MTQNNVTSGQIFKKVFAENDSYIKDFTNINKTVIPPKQKKGLKLSSVQRELEINSSNSYRESGILIINKFLKFT